MGARDISNGTFPPGASPRQEPAAWAAMHDDPALIRRGFVFRRSLEETHRACTELARPGERWIDAGCGAGHLTARLAERGLRVVGVDRDPAALAMAYCRRPDAAVAPVSAAYLAATVERLPIPDGIVDGVAAASLVGCLDDLSRFVAEAHRVLRRGGALVLTVTNRASWLLRVNYALHAPRPRQRPGPSDPSAYKLYRPREILAVLRKAGFEPLEARFYNYFLNVGPWLLPPARIAAVLRHRARLDRAGDRLARNFLVVAERP